MGIKQKTSELQRRMRDALMGGGDKAIEKQPACADAMSSSGFVPCAS